MNAGGVDEESAGRRYYRHGLRRMMGRDRRERRAASPLELLYDLTFVAAFGVAGNELAHGIASGHWAAALASYAAAMIAIVWAWTNFSWFASAFDTDDWLFRLLTIVQMIGVVVLAAGLPALFASIEESAPVIDNTVMVVGYVIMRVALVLQWLRAGATDPTYRSASLTNALFIGLGQIGWVALAVLHLSGPVVIAIGVALWAFEMLGPILAERKGGRTGGATPWHPHHIAERYSLLAIIALGETVFGTLAATQAIAGAEGWGFDAIMTVTIGTSLAFALWWVYFLVPSAPVLEHRRSRGYVWGYAHIAVYASIAAVGAGLHVVAYQFDDHYEVTTVTAVTAIAVPVLTFGVALGFLQIWLIGRLPRSIAVQSLGVLLPVSAILLARAGVPEWVCLLFVLGGPAAVVVSYELGGWRVLAAQLDDSLSAVHGGRGNRGDASSTRAGD